MNTIFAYLHSWAASNTIVALLLALLALMVWRMAKNDYWRLVWREITANKTAVVSACILAIYASIAILDSVGWRRPLRDHESGAVMRNEAGKVIYDSGASALDYLLKPLSSKKEITYSAPFAETQFTPVMEVEDGRVRQSKPKLKYPYRHICGTDRIGEDVLVQAIKSIRTALVIGILTTLVAVPFALFFGLTSGYCGGIFDTLVQFLCTLLNSIPSILLIAAIMLFFQKGLPQLCFAMGIGSWTVLCRLIRGETLKLREAEFTQASVALGMPAWKVMLRHILPNVMHIVLMHIVLRFSGLVLTEATLTYLGLGVSADTVSWGTMINDAREELTRDPVIWWKLTTAFCFMVGLVLPANLFGDAVRDALDPKLRTH